MIISNKPLWKRLRTIVEKTNFAMWIGRTPIPTYGSWSSGLCTLDWRIIHFYMINPGVTEQYNIRNNNCSKVLQWYSHIALIWMECLTVRINASFMLKLFCTGLEAKFFFFHSRQNGRGIVNRGRSTCLLQLLHLTRRSFLASLSIRKLKIEII